MTRARTHLGKSADKAGEMKGSAKTRRERSLRGLSVLFLENREITNRPRILAKEKSLGVGAREHRSAAGEMQMQRRAGRRAPMRARVCAAPRAAKRDARAHGWCA